MSDEMIAFLFKAEHALEVAERLLKDGYPLRRRKQSLLRHVLCRASCLESEKIDVVKHSAVESAFGYYLVKAGKIDAKYHRMLIDARKIREIADYDIQEEVVEPVSSLKIKDGKEFLSITREFLNNKKSKKR